MTPGWQRTMTAFLTLALLGTACNSGDDTGQGTTTTRPTTTEAPTATGPMTTATPTTTEAMTTRIVDDEGAISLSVPAEWTDVDGRISTIGADSDADIPPHDVAALVASTDIDAFLAGCQSRDTCYDTPGILVAASRTLGADLATRTDFLDIGLRLSDIALALEEHDIIAPDCDQRVGVFAEPTTGFDQKDTLGAEFGDVFVHGDLFVECGTSGATFLEMFVYSQSHEVLLQVQAIGIDDAGKTEANDVLESLRVETELLPREPPSSGDIGDPAQP